MIMIESESKKLEVRKTEMEKQINLWLKKQANGLWAVNGFIHDIETKEVIAGATVHLDQVPTQTSERGFFLFDGIEAGEHMIVVGKEGYESTNDLNKPSMVSFVI